VGVIKKQKERLVSRQMGGWRSYTKRFRNYCLSSLPCCSCSGRTCEYALKRPARSLLEMPTPVSIIFTVTSQYVVAEAGSKT
jgi:hypothetical protein